MKAIAVFPKEKKVRLIDNHPEPNIESPTQVKIKILEVGVCGTDHDICQFQYGTPPQGSDYLVIGHESLGQVVEVGSAVTDFKVGDLAVLMVRRPCSHKTCVACQANRQDFCYTGDFKERGINQLHGFMTEYVVDEQKYILRAPQTLRNIAVLTEPLTIAEKAVREIFHIQMRLPWGCSRISKDNTPTYNTAHRALVLGAGPVGLLATLVLCNQKFDTFVYSREPNTDMRAKIVTALGATYFSAQNATLKDIIKKQNVPGVAKTPEVVANANSLHTQPASTVAINNKIIGNLDVIFDATGASRLAFEATDLLGFNGIFVWTGIPGRQDPVDINAGTFMQNVVLKNQNLVGSVNAGHEDFRSAIQNLGELSQSLNELLSPLIKRYTVDKYADLLLQPPVANTLKSAISFS
ncbi:MAG: hypothetical protein A3I77_01885 [Gammaproteobacteria bacterium RIFCSPLOWO2_02_FULL_42_14]|nr:MAG: hypothetical protein A3B71_04495 [Gammaproteobacteria bacterium RIFCSPHIGHO2_02_FULL_42_43]OGT50861.1 MAG: hypothetical protein A3E54_03735 [Gammaproteobacteria bacterium RIFCSPHIGHO2_12_FULL_41_25]OGT62544.1 MAG: hypothetical protein A3I77_01885 [Gammaproteobacteria bacterium RIFCSPLOWO2_02_FULL_42_14]OGT86527.1 MAG: hypothetical protein A3G86_08405 [Gammaproteobacteria bacterium RIFCSPLOWO2_12_FULL_42_18]